ncbi:3-hydroxyisobutyryl-CoA hydrolase 1 [Zea mays]|uniref:3-hydroxyisobutyryl-CoA hydrolase 1 n=1 Tax=Zea mays TaxID=4577 RepID=A0A3L6D915_MAIZE|nr:3-hydroxyisobutyryl-CoA hydrolase 1 [Zea mays]
MDPSVARRQEAERFMNIAEKLLMARDLEGCKQFVAQALSFDPRTPGADDLLAAADALLAAQRRRLPSGPLDPYAVLGLDSAVPASRDPDVVHSHYRRLSLLLNRSHPDRPCSLAFADAARLVADAWAFLSDPLRKASLDSDLDAAAAATNAAAAAAAAATNAAAAAAAARVPIDPHPEKQNQLQSQPPPPPPLAPQPMQTVSGTPPPKRGRPPRAAKTPATTPAPQPPQTVSGTSPTKRGRPPRAAKQSPEVERNQEGEAQQAPVFWTACPSCCHLHQYDHSYESQTLLCPSCRRPFVATAMSTQPPIVPGTDMYYCSWGFFPMGFPGGPAFAEPLNSPQQQAPAALGFYPMGPYLPLPSLSGIVEGEGNKAVDAGTGIPVIPTMTWALAKEEHFLLEVMLLQLSDVYIKVSLLTGIVMGLGAGVSLHGRFRVATDNTLHWMPPRLEQVHDEAVVEYFSRIDDPQWEDLDLPARRSHGRTIESKL